MRRPADVTAERQDGEDALAVEAGHDGYRQPLGVVHKRRLSLVENGDELRGEDRLIGGPGHRYAIRFHLHHETETSAVQSGAAALLRLNDGSGWRLRVTGAVLSIEPSVYCPDGLVPKRSQQVVLSGTTEDGETLVKWSLRREKK